jgi:hypothetical protein
MIIKLLLLLAVSSTCFSLPLSAQLPEQQTWVGRYHQVLDKFTAYYENLSEAAKIYERKTMLEQAEGLSPPVINKILTTLNCSDKHHVEHNNILTVIDYSLPSSEKRLWVFDLQQKKLLFHTYVSHGITSGALLTTHFSNKYNSKASSIGVYTTEKAYYGREGLSLRLDGLDRGFNDNASGRSIVMHGGWYVAENFIKKYGRPGRSWGCPALPLNLVDSVINTIKDKSLFVVYYPSDHWFAKSRFLRCDQLSSPTSIGQLQQDKAPPIAEKEPRESILFADMNNNNRREENEPIVVMAADDYQRLVNTKVPLERMLRRQINNMEYVALSNTEFKDKVCSSEPQNADAVSFVIPEVKMRRGYYATEMHIVPLGKIKEAKPDETVAQYTTPAQTYTVLFETRPTVNLKSTNQFIRWLGL